MEKRVFFGFSEFEPLTRLVFIAISGLIKKQVFEAGNVVTLGADARYKKNISFFLQTMCH